MTGKRFSCALVLSAASLVMLLCFACSGKTDDASTAVQMERRTISDLADRTVSLPTEINTVVCLHPIPDYMVWALDPDKMASRSRVFTMNLKGGRMPFPDAEIKRLMEKPEVPVFFDAVDPEQLLSLRPDVIVSMTKDPKLEDLQKQVNIPVVAISKDTLQDYEASFRFMGDLLGNTERGNTLADYWHNIIAKITEEVALVPNEQRLRVYYASHDGPLSTVGRATVMSSIITLAGGIDYATTDDGSSMKATDEHVAISLEQVLLWDPQVIITKTADTREAILSNPQWAQVSAVKSQRVYASPAYAALDGIMSLMSLGWVAETLYPDTVGFDVVNECKSFYSLFYRNDSLTSEEILQEQ
ncbi:ABC transporter substrate-binding protein [Sediminispirochaeta smaragdinae]|uniref:Periplasmic binding protein n=1 Tax=Sediminispirochaeta smaragdinae (strain DSM 11293 / JCM 15392 / SEBR 4228) TaxID=573413 RepID=E1R2J9_SEDSS|nr:ABC transporter substrate-binding protein [Sediminispirochaeta smaragdinae]ADK82559.1 periplasmic binding protein [Sediminispirochaeta smaragdinae DSM 11293]